MRAVPWDGGGLLYAVTDRVFLLWQLFPRPDSMTLEHILLCWLPGSGSNWSLGCPAYPLHTSPSLSFVLQKSPEDPNDSLLPSGTGTGNLVLIRSRWDTAVPAQRVESQAHYFRRRANLGATDFCQRDDEMSTSHWRTCPDPSWLRGEQKSVTEVCCLGSLQAASSWRDQEPGNELASSVAAGRLEESGTGRTQRQI